MGSSRSPEKGHGIVNADSHQRQTGFTTEAHQAPASSQTVRTSNDQAESKGRDLMGSVVIQCPATGHTISTGIEADRLKFACSPVFFSDAYCPMCNANHRWFARDAWVEEREAIAEAA
jgi:hypothetical protein